MFGAPPTSLLLLNLPLHPQLEVLIKPIFRQSQGKSLDSGATNRGTSQKLRYDLEPLSLKNYHAQRSLLEIA